MRLYLKYMWEYVARNKNLSFATILVITITFTLINVFISAQIIVDKTASYLNKQQKISILYNPEAKEEDILKFKKQLEEFPAVKTVIYKDSKTLQKENLKSLGFSDEEIKTFLDNQEEYIKILQIELKPQEDITSLINFIKESKDKGAPIMNVLYFEDLLTKIKTISRGLKISGALITTLLLFISLQLIYFTISFTIIKHKDEIRTMYLVGAPKDKITIPLALQGAFYGTLSAVISFTLGLIGLYIIRTLLRENLFVQVIKNLLITTGVRELLSIENLLLFLLVEAATGFILGFMFAKLAINNTIKKLNYE